MEVTILNPEGVHESEKDAISELRASLPNSWKGYASLELIDRAQGPSEMDLVVVTADRLIIVELKNWNGPLFARDGHWFVFDDDRGRSPVDVTANKSRKLAGRIRKKLDGKLKRIPWVDYCVVLCGTSDKSNLPEDQAAFVVSLEDFKKAGTPTVYDNLFPKKLHFKDKSLRPNQHIDLWDRFFTGNREVAPEI
tara:strand:- start:26 stop:607 length:582 start_codon:yes stop_codon:yes gene_type:complete